MYILPLLTQLSCVYLPRFWLFCLFVYLWFGFLVLLFVCVFLWFGFLVAAGFLLFCRNSTFPVFPHITSCEQRNSKATPLQIGSKPTIIEMQKTLQTTSTFVTQESNCIYTISCQNIKTTPFRKNFMINFKRILFLSNVPQKWGTLDTSMGTPDRSKKVGFHALHNVHVISDVK